MSDKQIKMGLALGGGYARGLAHIGVLEVLEREGIPVHLVAGTSAGAIIGALYARDLNVGLIRKQALELDWRAIKSLIGLGLPRSGFIGDRRVLNLLKKYFGDSTFAELKMPFACVATDILTGEEVVIKEGRVVDGVRASMSVPVIFTAAKLNGRFLVDGGLINPVPVSVAKEMGADFIIAVNVTPAKAERAKFLAGEDEEPSKEPGIFTVMIQAIYISSDLSSQSVSEGASIVIRPHLAHIGPAEFHRTEELILAGKLAAEDAIPEIKRQLGLLGKRRDSSGQPGKIARMLGLK